jgi:hypothetical protein
MGPVSALRLYYHSDVAPCVDVFALTLIFKKLILL